MTHSIGPPPPFDLEYRHLMESLPRPFPVMNDESRLAMRRTPPVALDDLRLDGAYDVSETEGNGVTLVVARPTGRDGPVPCLYLLHYGGMIVGDPRSAAARVLEAFAQPLGLAVVAAGYRLAPDVQAPALAEDCYAGFTWLVENCVELGIERDQVIMLGISGGGGLAASCAFLARDRGGPSLRALMLMYPMLDDRSHAPSVHQMADAGIWRRADNEYAWRQVLGNRVGADDVTPYESAARATDLRGLPPTFLDVSSSETLRDEVVELARSIWLAGGAAELHVWDGGFHGFDLALPGSALGRLALQTKRDWIARQLRG